MEALAAADPDGAGVGSRRRAWLAAAGALLVAALFAWNVASTWSIGDDAFISFRYARHLADGLGLVWNEGERVEGYTNFLWVLAMAAGMELGLAPERLSNALGVACGVALLVAAFRFAARGRGPASPAPWLLVLVFASSKSFAAWCSGGLETMAFALFVFLGWARLLSAWRGPLDAVGCALLFAAAALTRPEGALFGALAFAWLALDVLRGLRPARAALAWLAPFALVVGAHLLWRRAYYGEWVPNTFHAKVGGLWLEQGARYLAYFHDCYRIGWFLPLALPALLGPRRRDAAAVALALLAYFGYVLAVGGDVFELRFCVHAFPLLYWLLVEGLASLAERAPRPAGTVLAAAGALALLATTHLGFQRAPANAYGIQSIEGITEYTRGRIDEGKTLRRWIDAGVLPRDVVLCAGGAGAVPYYTGWTTVDRRGLNDARIARMPVEGGRGFVGHEHDAPHEYLVERGVEVFDFDNRLLVKVEGLRSLARRGPYRHDGRPLSVRVIELDERALVFATFVDDAALARRFPGVEIRPLER